MTEGIKPFENIGIGNAIGGSFLEEMDLFLNKYPQYQKTEILSDLREKEYANLDRQNHVYLDFTGGGLYAASQLDDHLALLSGNVFGNPHSTNPTSMAITKLVNQARSYVLEFFHADPKEYVCIFTQNASGALKLVGESYPFAKESQYLLTVDNHNSVNGIREFARKRNAEIRYVPVTLPELRMDERVLEAYLSEGIPGQNNLFAFPAQSNFSGVQHDFSWIKIAQTKGWDVLLDAAAFVPTNQLNLSEILPDFVVLSFYKMFGYPTGVGALIARRSALEKLHRPWFAGGTITVASVQGDRHFFHSGPEGFEDGTLNYLSLPAVEIGLHHLKKIGYSIIHDRVESLTGWLLEKLSMLSHTNGQPVIKIYGPLNTAQRGGTIVMNFFDPNGHFVDHLKVESVANQMNISLRTGCFCNPGDGEMALGISENELRSCFTLKQQLEYQDFRRCLDDKSSGAVRVSVGLVSNFEDVFRMVNMVKRFINKNHDEIEE
jgi:selenocysteine lyase/cysteine desulfurase